MLCFYVKFSCFTIIFLSQWLYFSFLSQDSEVCCNNYLGSTPNKASPKGLWSSIPDPEVRELVLSPQDKFLVFGDNAFSRTVPADEVCRQIQNTSSPVVAGKSLSEMYSALTSGRRECIAVIMFKSDANPPEEEGEKYRWDYEQRVVNLYVVVVYKSLT